jgi:hypothetical protein
LTKKNTIRALFCSTIVLAPIFIWIGYFTALQINRHHIKERLEYENLQTISLSNNEFTWVNDEEEILINQQLFDVQSYTQSGNTYTFIGIYDNQEDSIKLQLKKLDQSSNKNSLPYHSLLLKLLSPALLNTNNGYFSVTTTDIQSVYTMYCPPIYNNHWLQVATPPPIV